MRDLTLLSGGWEGTIRVWDLPTGKLVKHLSGFGVQHGPGLASLDAVPGAIVATGARSVGSLHSSVDGCVRLWIWDVERPLMADEGAETSLHEGETEWAV